MSKPEKELLCVGADGKTFDGDKVAKVIFSLHAKDNTLGQLRNVDFVTNSVTTGSVFVGNDGRWPFVVKDGILTYRDVVINLIEWKEDGKL